jgi:hypothetical protein
LKRTTYCLLPTFLFCRLEGDPGHIPEKPLREFHLLHPRLEKGLLIFGDAEDVIDRYLGSGLQYANDFAYCLIPLGFYLFIAVEAFTDLPFTVYSTTPTIISS